MTQTWWGGLLFRLVATSVAAIITFFVVFYLAIPLRGVAVSVLSPLAEGEVGGALSKWVGQRGPVDISFSVSGLVFTVGVSWAWRGRPRGSAVEEELRQRRARPDPKPHTPPPASPSNEPESDGTGLVVASVVVAVLAFVGWQLWDANTVSVDECLSETDPSSESGISKPHTVDCDAANAFFRVTATAEGLSECSDTIGETFRPGEPGDTPSYYCLRRQYRVGQCFAGNKGDKKGRVTVSNADIQTVVGCGSIPLEGRDYILRITEIYAGGTCPDGQYEWHVLENTTLCTEIM